MKTSTFFALAQVGFFAMMWTSKSAHLLYFESHGATVNFGLSYSAMAFAGYFSFFTGHLCDWWGFRKTLIGGTLLYSLGLALRIFPDSAAVAVTSGLIAGLGASVCLSAFRVWMVSISTEESRPRLVGLKTSTMALGSALGCFSLSALTLSDHLALGLSYKTLLLTSSVGLVVLAIGFYGCLPKVQAAATMAKKAPIVQVFASLYGRYRQIAVMTVILGITTGFYVSFISPYLPLIMKDRGLDLAAIGLSTGAFSLLRFFIDPHIARQVGKYRQQALGIFIASEVVVGLITAAFLLPASKSAFLLFLLLRSGALGFSAISEEILWLRIFPTESIGLFFGLNQSSYFLGDFVGGLVNGYLYKDHGLDLCIEVVLVIMVLNAFLFFWLFEKKGQTVAKRDVWAA